MEDDHVPVVMLAAVAGERGVVQGFVLGPDGYILKPFSSRSQEIHEAMT
jgi:DNA-binding response OmpR family regulator